MSTGRTQSASGGKHRHGVAFNLGWNPLVSTQVVPTSLLWRQPDFSLNPPSIVGGGCLRTRGLSACTVVPNSVSARGNMSPVSSLGGMLKRGSDMDPLLASCLVTHLRAMLLVLVKLPIAPMASLYSPPYAPIAAPAKLDYF
mgnify:CR=1 FL=1